MAGRGCAYISPVAAAVPGSHQQEVARSIEQKQCVELIDWVLTLSLAN